MRRLQNRTNVRRRPLGPPPKQGLYDPWFEHDACGVGFVVNIKGRKSHQIVKDAVRVLLNLNHRGACGCEPNTGDGAGILLQMPHGFLQEVCKPARIALPGAGEYGCGLVFLPPGGVGARPRMFLRPPPPVAGGFGG